MKQNIQILFSFLFILCAGLLGCDSQPQTPTLPASEIVSTVPDSSDWDGAEQTGDSAKAVLQRIFESVLMDDCQGIAHFVAYRGIGGEGDYKRSCDYALPDERVTVDKICAQIKVMLHGLSQTLFEEFTIEEEKEGFWHVWQVHFDYEDGNSNDRIFALIEANGLLLLGDID